MSYADDSIKTAKHFSQTVIQPGLTTMGKGDVANFKKSIANPVSRPGLKKRRARG